MILGYKSLLRKAGLKQSAALRRWLKSQGIAFMADAKGRPMTTLDAFNRALYGKRNQPDWSPPRSPSKSIKNMGATTTSTRIVGIRSRV